MSLMFSDGSRPRLTEGNRRPGNPAVLAGRPPALELPLATAAALTAAFLGGWLDLHSVWIERLVALVLLISALRFVQTPQDPPLLLALGLLSGLTSPGGSMFLTSLLQLRGWASTGQAAAVPALFIFGYSFCGVAGLLLSRQAEKARGPWPACAICSLRFRPPGRSSR